MDMSLLDIHLLNAIEVIVFFLQHTFRKQFNPAMTKHLFIFQNESNVDVLWCAETFKFLFLYRFQWRLMAHKGYKMRTKSMRLTIKLETMLAQHNIYFLHK